MRVPAALHFAHQQIQPVQMLCCMSTGPTQRASSARHVAGAVYAPTCDIMMLHIGTLAVHNNVHSEGSPYVVVLPKCSVHGSVVLLSIKVTSHELVHDIERGCIAACNLLQLLQPATAACSPRLMKWWQDTAVNKVSLQDIPVLHILNTSPIVTECTESLHMHCVVQETGDAKWHNACLF